jgi:hypothetical protein
MDPCSSLPHPADWNPIAGGGPASAFAAVLAGFVFIGMVYVLTEGFDRYHGHTLMLFMAAFVCLAAGSYIEALASGETACLRAWSEEMFSSGLLAVGSTAMLAALAWLLPTRYGRDPIVRRFTITAAMSIAVIASELLATAAEGFLLDVPGESHWRGLVGLSTWMIIVLVLAAGLLRLANALQDRHRVAIAASAVIVFTFLSLIFLVPIGDIPRAEWVSPAPSIVVASTVIPLYGGALVLAAITWALPNKRSWPAPEANEGAPRQRIRSGQGSGLPSE